MVRNSLLLPILIVVGIIVSSCTEVVYDHPLDIEGTYKELYQQQPGAFNDDNNDGIVNFLDPTDTIYRLIDKMPPIITLIGDDTVFIPLNDTNNMVNFFKDQYNAVDEGGGPVNRLPTEENINPYTINIDAEPYTMIYHVSDTAGNEATAVRYFFVYKPATVDVDPPIFMIGDTLVEILQGTGYIDANPPSAYDFIDGDLTKNIVTAGEDKIDTLTPGDYILTYTVSDLSGNIATATRIVRVLQNYEPDITNPVITLNPPDTILLEDEISLEDYKAVYQEPGYNAVDDRDGVITDKVVASDIMLLTANLWYITYDVADAAGNRAATVKRYIRSTKIIYNDPPIIDLFFPDSVIQIVLPNGTWNEPGYDASDLNDGDITDKVIVDDSVLMANIDSIGTYIVTYSVTNSKGLSSQATRTVQVVDNPFDIIPPVITFLGRNPDSVQVNSATTYTDPGYTAIDERDGDVSEKVSPNGTVNMKKIGKYSINYSVADSAGNVARATRIVWVVKDTTADGLLDAYDVPYEDILPSIKGTFTTFVVDGEGPELKNVDKLTVSWDAQPTQLRLHDMSISQKNNAQPNFVSLTNSKQTFGEENPTLTVSSSQIQGLDGKYYVIYYETEDEFVWVEQSGKYAIIWQR